MIVTAAIALLLAAPKLCAGPPGYAAVAMQAVEEPPASIARVAAMPSTEALLEVVVVNDERALVNARLEISPPHKSIPAPRVYLLDEESDVALPLPDFWPMESGEALPLLLRYQVTADAKPGRHEHTLRLSADNLPRSQELVVTLSVAEATRLSPIPAIAGVLWPSAGASPDAPLTPADLVNALHGMPIALWPRATDGASLRPEDMDAFAAAQSRLETAMPMSLGNVLPPPESALPRGFSARVQAAKLERWPQWAQEAIWSSGAYVELRVAGVAGAAAELTETLRRWKEQWPKLRVMLVGPYMPALQHYADAWALPSSFAHVAGQLAAGHMPQPGRVKLDAASDGTTLDGWPELLSTADFALDGSEATWWQPVPLMVPWVEVLNTGGARIGTLEVVADRAPALVQSALPGHPMSDSTVTWSPQSGGTWLGTFKYPAAFERLRLQFPNVKEGLRVYEIRLGDEDTPPKETTPVAPWLIVEKQLPHARQYANIIAAEAAGCAGLYLGDMQLRGVRLAIEGARKGEAPVLAWQDGRKLHPPISMLYLRQALQDAAMLRTLRMTGKLGAQEAASYLSLAQAVLSPAKEEDDALEPLKKLRQAREEMMGKLEGMR